MKIKNFLIIVFAFLSMQTNSYSADAYVYGSGKYFMYGVEKSDLQVINTSLIALGFSSSKSSTDNSGYGFDVGLGAEVAPNFFLEGGYVNYGTLTINTTTTGGVENIKTEIKGNGVTGAVKYETDGFYFKGGMHSWDFSGTVSTSLGSSSEALGSGTDPFFGIGFGTDGFEIGYEYYAIEEGDISSLTARISRKF
ncbi:outer membrane beta-barrel protein [Candidatus Pelagibacter sp.]|nr:outer membrane beta-barrel protein [Candidatus Pelagibacter sp.]